MTASSAGNNKLSHFIVQVNCVLIQQHSRELLYRLKINPFYNRCPIKVYVYPRCVCRPLENVSRLALWNLHTTPPITSARAVLQRRSRCAPVFSKDSKNEHWYACFLAQRISARVSSEKTRDRRRQNKKWIRAKRRRSWNYITNCFTSEVRTTASYLVFIVFILNNWKKNLFNNF